MHPRRERGERIDGDAARRNRVLLSTQSRLHHSLPLRMNTTATVTQWRDRVNAENRAAKKLEVREAHAHELGFESAHARRYPSDPVSDSAYKAAVAATDTLRDLLRQSANRPRNNRPRIYDRPRLYG